MSEFKHLDQQSTHPNEPLQAAHIAAIAHDFKNALTAISGNLSLLERLIEAPAAHALLSAAHKGVSHAAHLAHNLLNYTQGQKPKPTCCDAGSIIRDVAQFTLAGTQTQVIIDMPDEMPSVQIDATSLTQILQNLMLNATQAMNNQGSLTIRGTIINKNKKLQLTLEDTGPGLPPQRVATLFSAPFTTKKEGHGIGLQQVNKLIQEAGGQITVASKLGQGTVFTINLPLRLKRSSKQLPRKSPTAHSKNTRVLVVDDDAMIRELAREMLRCLGYQAESVDRGEEAVRRYREARDTGVPFESVILDLTLSDALDGKGILDQLKELNPELKAILSTGHSHHPVVQNYKRNGFQGCVLKPYSIEDLEKTMNKLINY